MSDELTARARLFAAIEGGSEFWSGEIAKIGSEALCAKLLAGGYLESRHSGAKISERLASLKGEEVLEQIANSGAFLLAPNDPDWPMQLEDLAAPPIALLVKGEREFLAQLKNSIAIVGTRNPTGYGVRIAEDFAAGACDREWAVISGGAMGIDAAAHRGALAAEGLTVAVLGGGFNKNYPAAHENLFAEISQIGLLISEVMPDVPAAPHRFLIRNRLIASISKATIVVEAAFRSGSLRTARDAAEIFRPVMAVPGPINSPTSEGCHRLISERCAELVSSISDVMELVLPLALK